MAGTRRRPRSGWGRRTAIGAAAVTVGWLGLAVVLPASADEIPTVAGRGDTPDAAVKAADAKCRAAGHDGSTTLYTVPEKTELGLVHLAMVQCGEGTRARP